jgi:hypothetical protein
MELGHGRWGMEDGGKGRWRMEGGAGQLGVNEEWMINLINLTERI